MIRIANWQVICKSMTKYPNVDRAFIRQELLLRIKNKNNNNRDSSSSSRHMAMWDEVIAEFFFFIIFHFSGAQKPLLLKWINVIATKAHLIASLAFSIFLLHSIFLPATQHFYLTHKRMLAIHSIRLFN